MNDIRKIDLNQVLLNRIKTLGSQQSPVSFNAILQASNRDEDTVKAILKELLEAQQIQEIEPHYYVVTQP